MKTAQELRKVIAENSGPSWHGRGEPDHDPEPYRQALREAKELAYEHTFGKGHNPEAMGDLIKTLALCYATTEDFVLINAIKSCLEKAKLK